MRDDGTRSLMGTLGSGVLGIGLGLGILAVGFVVSRMVLPDNVVEATVGTPVPSASRSAAPTAAAATTGPTAGAPGAPTGTTAPAATPKPSPTPDPAVVTAYQGQGLRLALIAIPAGYTFTSPIGGKVSIALYQYVDGRIVQGVTDQPSYPYVFVASADRQIKIRPGVIDRDIRLLVKDGDTVAAGAPLFTTITTGASSWATFYDSSVGAQIVASVIALPANVEVDPVPIFKR